MLFTCMTTEKVEYGDGEERISDVVVKSFVTLRGLASYVHSVGGSQDMIILLDGYTVWDDSADISVDASGAFGHPHLAGRVSEEIVEAISDFGKILGVMKKLEQHITQV